MSTIGPPELSIPRIRLNQGGEIPAIGLGVFKSEPGAVTRNAVHWALEAGYRHVDTAALYRNESDVGLALRESGLPRDELFVTTKLWHTEQGFEAAQRAAHASLERLGLDYVDLYLIHWPRADPPSLRLDSWKALEKLQREGLCRNIGVSNYARRHLEELLEHTSVVPAVDQVEFHPFVYDPDLLDFCREKGIRVEAWSPLTRSERLDHPEILRIARGHGRTPAQVLLRWGFQHGIVELPKSVHQERIRENARIFDFSLTDEEMHVLDGLRDGRRVGPDPREIP
jgi:diketogulonate reductase-like aldo/keto reductase